MPDDALLEVAGLDAFYGDFQALFGLSLRVREGEVVAVIGANGAGKSTLLKRIAGLMPARAETIRFAGAPIGHLRADAVVARGIALVPEGRRLFSSLTVEENLADRRPASPARPVVADAHLRAVSGARRASSSAQHLAVGRPAADGGDRTRADVEPSPPAV